MKVKVILNPYANGFKAGQRSAAVHDALSAAGLNYDLTVVSRPGQGKEEAQAAAANRYDAVVAAGGDGTVNEIVNGLLVVAGQEVTCPLGILPLGTGNDFSDMMGLPRDLVKASRVIASRRTRQIDAGWVSYSSGNGAWPELWRGHYFDNNCAAAMEPVVTLEAQRISRLSGPVRYLVAMLRSLRKLTAWEMDITWDDGRMRGPAYLLSIANTPRTGGLFSVAPGACSHDGLLDFVVVPAVGRTEVLSILSRLLRGTHLRDARVVSGRTRHLVIDSRPATPLHADGEVLTRSARTIHVQVLPGKITLLMAST